MAVALTAAIIAHEWQRQLFGGLFCSAYAAARAHLKCFLAASCWCRRWAAEWKWWLSTCAHLSSRSGGEQCDLFHLHLRAGSGFCQQAELSGSQLWRWLSPFTCADAEQQQRARRAGWKRDKRTRPGGAFPVQPVRPLAVHVHNGRSVHMCGEPRFLRKVLSLQQGLYALYYSLSNHLYFSKWFVLLAWSKF